MIQIASSDVIKIYCSENDRFAFFNSPYLAHRMMTSLDIYPSAEFGDIVLSPVSGEIIYIRKIKAPTGRFFKDAGYDYIIILRNELSKDLVIKILHVEPSVSVGEKLDVGRSFGKLLRSGYFSYTTSPHVHLEVRPSNDPLRVRNGLIIENILDIGEPEALEKLKGNVKSSGEGSYLIELENCSEIGLPANAGRVNCILDGGIPVYGWFGAHSATTLKVDNISFLGIPIGKIIEVAKDVCIARCSNFYFMCKNININIFLTLSPIRKPLVKIASLKRGKLKLEDGEEVEIRISRK